MTDKEITELNLKSATYYGAQLQMNHFTEELAELIQAAAEGDPQHIAEKIADVEVVVEQMEYLLSLDTIYIESWATHILLANDIESCIWHLAAPIKSINKLRRVNLATAADPDMSKSEVQIKRQTANHDLETDIGELVSYLNWLAGRYSIAAEEIREIKSYKVQRTRDRIELETGSICKKVVDDKAVAQAQDLADYCKQQTECEPGGCIFATTGEGCILSDYVRPELWPDAIAQQLQEGQKNG